MTDTTFRDAHQSLLATRFRTIDLVNVAEAYAHGCPELFSLEMWGGATFDTSMRFLKESPWDRLAQMRDKVPNILLQMLLRASNAVGYTNYPDNVVQAFVREAADAGIDVFRVFDALNWVPNMRVAMDAVLDTDAICEAAICYTGDILDPARSKYDLKYYVGLAKELESMGAHILAIKDMAGLCKPAAARLLVKTLKQEIGLPIHFHTHDTAGIQAAADSGRGRSRTGYRRRRHGAPVGRYVAAQSQHAWSRPCGFPTAPPQLHVDRLDSLADYWRAVREFYTPFESQVLPATADLYKHEMPGGQYTNLYQQARALGLVDQWSRICHVYARGQRIVWRHRQSHADFESGRRHGPVHGRQRSDAEDVLTGEREFAYPASVLDLIGGNMGQPPGGFPPAVQTTIAQGPSADDRTSRRIAAAGRL